MAALTIVTAVLTALKILPTPALILPFIASTTARRFGLSPIDASIDAEGLWLGDMLVAPRADIIDAWADPDDTDRRVAVAVKPDELIVVHLPNLEQAKRFASELRPRSPANAHVVAGVRPGAVDTLFPIRLFAVIASFVANAGLESPAVLLLFVFFGIGAYGFVVATQIDAGPDGLTLRTFARSRHLPWAEVTDEILDKLPARYVRSPLLTTSPWTKHAHARVMERAKSEMKKRK
jgi:hypothetical protein